MAITTLDGALAGMQATQMLSKAATPTLVAGRPASLWYLGGAPGTGAAPANTSTGTVLTCGTSYGANVAGQIPRIDPGSGNSYLGRLSGVATISGMLLLCDRLLQCAGTTAATAIGTTTTTAQALSTATLPARDNTGTTNGYGVMAGLEVVVLTGAGTPTLTISYTAAGGATSHSATNIDTVVATSAIGAFYRLGLQTGDAGIQTVNSLTISATMTSGTVCLVLYRILAALELPGALIPNAIDALTSGFPQIFNGTVPFFIFIPNTTTATTVTGTYTETQG